MATVNTTSTLDGLFKSTYGTEPIDAIPQSSILQKMVKFKDADKTGDSYKCPVILSSENGVTFLAAGEGVATLNDSVAATLKNALVDGSQIFLRGQIDYEAAAKAETGKTAFVNATDLMVQNLVDSASKHLEMSFLYGQSGLGKFASAGATTTRTFTLTAATHAPGIWAGAEGLKLDVYNGSTKINTNADIVVTSVDIINRTVLVSGNATDLTACDASANAYDLYRKGAYGKECAGLDKIITNSSTLFGISASTYNLWAGSSYSAGSAALTMQKVLSAVSQAVGKGGLSEEVHVLVNPQTWSNLNSSEAALRMYDGSYSSSKSENGVEAIVYHGQSGKINIVSHPMVKGGEAFIVPMKRLKRVGASELSFKTPGRKDEIFLHRQDQNAYEMRIYGHQAIFIETPAKCVKITGIVNS